MSAIFAARDAIVSDRDRLIAESMHSGWQAGSADRVTDDCNTIGADGIHPALE